MVLSALNEIEPVALNGVSLNVAPEQAADPVSKAVVDRHTSWIVQVPTKSPPQGVIAAHVDPPLLAPATFPAPAGPEPEVPPGLVPALELAPACAVPGPVPPAPALADEPPHAQPNAANKNTARESNIE